MKRVLIQGALLLIVCVLLPSATGNGRLLVPPQRSSLWREPQFYNNYDVYRNYDDHTLDCGGYWKLHENQGRCGVCGDPWDDPEPRPNEAGGLYGRGIIGRKYSTEDRMIFTVVQVTSSFGGYFQFFLCPNNDVTKVVTRECLEENPLTIYSRDGKIRYDHRYTLDIEEGEAGAVQLNLEVPPGMECTQCVLQWQWKGANNYGLCRNGRWGKGCGEQPEIYNCADISILPYTSQYSNSLLQRPSPTTTRTEGTTTTNGTLPAITSTARHIFTNTTRSPTSSTEKSTTTSPAKSITTSTVRPTTTSTSTARPTTKSTTKSTTTTSARPTYPSTSLGWETSTARQITTSTARQKTTSTERPTTKFKTRKTSTSTAGPKATSTTKYTTTTSARPTYPSTSFGWPTSTAIPTKSSTGIPATPSTKRPTTTFTTTPTTTSTARTTTTTTARLTTTSSERATASSAEITTSTSTEIPTTTSTKIITPTSTERPTTTSTERITTASTERPTTTSTEITTTTLTEKPTTTSSEIPTTTFTETLTTTSTKIATTISDEIPTTTSSEIPTTTYSEKPTTTFTETLTTTSTKIATYTSTETSATTSATKPTTTTSTYPSTGLKWHISTSFNVATQQLSTTTSSLSNDQVSATNTNASLFVKETANTSTNMNITTSPNTLIINDVYATTTDAHVTNIRNSDNFSSTSKAQISSTSLLDTYPSTTDAQGPSTSIPDTNALTTNSQIKSYSSMKIYVQTTDSQVQSINTTNTNVQSTDDQVKYTNSTETYVPATDTRYQSTMDKNTLLNLLNESQALSTSKTDIVMLVTDAQAESSGITDAYLQSIDAKVSLNITTEQTSAPDSGPTTARPHLTMLPTTEAYYALSSPSPHSLWQIDAVQSGHSIKTTITSVSNEGIDVAKPWTTSTDSNKNTQVTIQSPVTERELTKVPVASGMSNLDDMINVLKDIINKTKVKNNETTGATLTPDKFDTTVGYNNIGNHTYTSPTVSSTQLLQDLNETASESDPWDASVYYNIFNSSLDQSNHTINTQSHNYSLLLTPGTISGTQNPQNNTQTQTILFTHENTSHAIHTTAALAMSSTHTYVQDNINTVTQKLSTTSSAVRGNNQISTSTVGPIVTSHPVSFTEQQTNTNPMTTTETYASDRRSTTATSDFAKLVTLMTKSNGTNSLTTGNQTNMQMRKVVFAGQSAKEGITRGISEIKHNLRMPDFIMKKIGTNANLQEFTTLELLVEALTELELLKTRLQSFESSELINSTLRNSEQMTGDSIMMEGGLSDWNPALNEASASTVTLPNIRETLPIMQPPLQSSSEPNTVIYDSRTSATPSGSKPYDVDIPIESQVTVSQKKSNTDFPEVVATKQDNQLSVPGLLGPGSIEVATLFPFDIPFSENGAKVNMVRNGHTNNGVDIK